MTTAAENAQQTPADAERTAPRAGAPLGLTVLPGLDGADAGLCVDGFCRLPGAKD
ncbi:hypothetical protein [Microbacterium capsulatum]|uniref:Uncharacterized protein n=1 Tax=Microbacterium capsulatum TaxID=3041921 RepID=A0ABU0XFS7_9MICO|nr:hypothetical protein [Microbacterium sp. ASV81]MDQ4213974.1 hypothetical protein [Microbacterium sp. ASV81]